MARRRLEERRRVEFNFDRIAVLGDEERAPVPSIEGLLLEADRLVAAMADGVPELRRVASRSHPMLACYPGDGARYVKHVDNPGGQANGRLLTLLVYLNEAWEPAHGGQLALHRADGSTVEVAPLLEALDALPRVVVQPHEHVLPTAGPAVVQPGMRPFPPRARLEQLVGLVRPARAAPKKSKASRLSVDHSNYSLCDTNLDTESTTEAQLGNFQRITIVQGPLTCLIGQAPNGPHLKIRSRNATPKAGLQLIPASLCQRQFSG